MCLAGLFHSVYGTPAYQQQVIVCDSQNRHRLRTIIGEQAELLVYLFSKTPREVLLQGDSINGCPRQPLGIDNVLQTDLFEIHAANLLEQAPEALRAGQAEWIAALSTIEPASHLLSSCARKALHSAILRSRRLSLFPKLVEA